VILAQRHQTSVDRHRLEHRGEPAPGDDDVIEERSTDQLRGLCEAAREGDVFLTGRRVPARVVVHEDEGARGLAQRAAQRVPRRHRKPVEPTLAHASRGTKRVAPVHRDEPQLLVIEGRNAGTGPGVHGRSVPEPGDWLSRGLEPNPAPELDGGSDSCRLCDPDAGAQGELARSGPREAAQTSLLGQEERGKNVGWLAGSSGAEQEGEQLGVTERVDPCVNETLTGAGGSDGLGLVDEGHGGDLSTSRATRAEGHICDGPS
jgi:hypothetical protein